MSRAKSNDTIVITLPNGWARAALAGIESALLAWIIPTAIVVAGFWAVASNPWFHEETWESAGYVGGNFWALSLLSPAPLGAVSVGMWPLGWTLVQLVLLRLLLFQARDYAPGAVWACVPAFALSSVLIAVFGTGAQWWRVTLGALAISLVAAAWAYLSYQSTRARLMGNRRWIWNALVGGLIAVGVAVTVSCILVLVAWIAGWSSFLEATSLLEVGGFSAFLLNLLQILFYPVLAGCAWAWVVGAGFAGPGGSTVGPGSTSAEALPVPVWALVPSGAGPNLIWIAVVIGLVLGIVFAWINRKATLVQVLKRFGVAAGCFLLVVTVWMWLSSGSLGDNLLSYLGPRPLVVLWRTALEVVLPALVVVAVMHRETFDYVQTLTTDTYGKVKKRAAEQAVEPELESEPSEDNIEP